MRDKTEERKEIKGQMKRLYGERKGEKGKDGRRKEWKEGE